MDTALGNVLIMCMLMMSYCKSIGLRFRDYALVNNGDDNVLICERRDAHKFESMTEWFAEMGFRMKVESIIDEIEKVEFCQC
jgi:hypothetical protein